MKIRKDTLKEYVIGEFKKINGGESLFKPSFLTKVLPILLKTFKSRVSLNEDLINYLENEPAGKFLDAIKSLRKKYSIPDLSEDDDSDMYADLEGLGTFSNWLNSLKVTKFKDFEKDVQKTLDCFSLPDNFFEWLVRYILYGKPKTIPTFHLTLPYDFAKNPKKYIEIGLTTNEKEFVQQITKKMLSSTGHDRVSTKKLTTKIQVVLSKAKNKQRKKPTLERALRTEKIAEHIDFGKPYETENNKGDLITTKTKYFELAAELDKNLRSKSSRIKLGEKIKKGRKRLINQFNKKV